MKFIVTREVEVDSDEKAAEVLRLRDLGFRVLFEGEPPRSSPPEEPKPQRAPRRRQRVSESLLEIARSGLTHEQIGGHLDVTRNTIGNWIHGHTRPTPEHRSAIRRLLATVRDTADQQQQQHRRLSEEERLQIAILREQGETYKSIGSKLQICMRTVYEVLQEFDLVSPRKQRRTSEQDSNSEATASPHAG